MRLQSNSAANLNSISVTLGYGVYAKRLAHSQLDESRKAIKQPHQAGHIPQIIPVEVPEGFRVRERGHGGRRVRAPAGRLQQTEAFHVRASNQVYAEIQIRNSLVTIF